MRRKQHRRAAHRQHRRRQPAVRRLRALGLRQPRGGGVRSVGECHPANALKLVSRPSGPPAASPARNPATRPACSPSRQLSGEAGRTCRPALWYTRRCSPRRSAEFHRARGTAHSPKPSKKMAAGGGKSGTRARCIRVCEVRDECDASGRAPPHMLRRSPRSTQQHTAACPVKNTAHPPPARMHCWMRCRSRSRWRAAGGRRRGAGAGRPGPRPAVRHSTADCTCWEGAEQHSRVKVQGQHYTAAEAMQAAVRLPAANSMPTSSLVSRLQAGVYCMPHGQLRAGRSVVVCGGVAWCGVVRHPPGRRQQSVLDAELSRPSKLHVERQHQHLHREAIPAAAGGGGGSGRSV